MQMAGIPKQDQEAHGPTPTAADDVFGVTFNDITKDTAFYHLDYYVTLRGLAWCLSPGTPGFVVAQG
jgi:hypothetical protein